MHNNLKQVKYALEWWSNRFLLERAREPVKPDSNLIENTHRSGQRPKEAHELQKLMLKQKLEEIILFMSFT